MTSRRTKISPKSGHGLGHVTSTILAVRSSILATAWLLVTSYCCHANWKLIRLLEYRHWERLISWLPDEGGGNWLSYPLLPWHPPCFYNFRSQSYLWLLKMQLKFYMQSIPLSIPSFLLASGDAIPLVFCDNSMNSHSEFLLYLNDLFGILQTWWVLCLR